MAAGRKVGVRAGGAAGFALPAALLALVVVAALAVGAFVAAREEAGLGTNSRLAEQAFEAAEAGAAAAEAQGATGAWGALEVGDSATLSGGVDGGAGGYAVTVRRLSERLFLVRSTGWDGSRGLERLVAVALRLEPAADSAEGAVSVAGGLVVDGTAYVDGRDAAPPGWTACPAPDTVAGVAAQDPGRIGLAGCAPGDCVAGRPPIRGPVPGPAGASFGGRSWDELAAMADRVYGAAEAGVPHTPGPSARGGVCARDAAENWGEPERPARVAACTGYFPVIHASGDLTLAGGRGQGVLLVAGDLTLAGGAEFDGVALVRGVVRSAGAGGRIRGALVVSGDAESALARVVVGYSRCAVAAALARVAPARPLPERSWSELR